VDFSWISKTGTRAGDLPGVTAMKTIGLIGGLSWVSTIDYYRILNQEMNARLGGHHSARIIMYSVEQADIISPTIQENWDNIERIVISAARTLEQAGADFIMICSNTIHKVADAVRSHIQTPILHIAEVTGQKIKTEGFSKVALLGSKSTMEDDFYKAILTKKYGLEIFIPTIEERETIDSIIFDELIDFRVYPSSKKKYIAIINRLIDEGAEGIILGCTEISILVKSEDCRAPIFDTTTIHALAAVEYAIGDAVDQSTKL